MNRLFLEKEKNEKMLIGCIYVMSCNSLYLHGYPGFNIAKKRRLC